MRGHARKASTVDDSGQTVTFQIEETTQDMINCKYDLQDTLQWVGDDVIGQENRWRTLVRTSGRLLEWVSSTIVRSRWRFKYRYHKLDIRIHKGWSFDKVNWSSFIGNDWLSRVWHYRRFDGGDQLIPLVTPWTNPPI